MPITNMLKDRVEKGKTIQEWIWGFSIEKETVHKDGKTNWNLMRWWIFTSFTVLSVDWIWYTTELVIWIYVIRKDIERKAKTGGTTS